MYSLLTWSGVVFVAAVTLHAGPANAVHNANLTDEEVRCQVRASMAGWKFFAKKAQCVVACKRGVRAGANPAADCVPPYDHETQGCVQGLEGKATGKVCRACTGDTPECYVGANCPAVADAKIMSIEAELDALLPTVYCDDSGSGDGLTELEGRCQDAVLLLLGRFAAKKARCLAKCRKWEHWGAVPVGSCQAGSVSDPTLKTQTCISTADEKSRLKIDSRCDPVLGGDPPECHGGTTGAGWTAQAEAKVDGQDPNFFCAN